MGETHIAAVLRGLLLVRFGAMLENFTDNWLPWEGTMHAQHNPVDPPDVAGMEDDRAAQGVHGLAAPQVLVPCLEQKENIELRKLHIQKSNS